MAMAVTQRSNSGAVTAVLAGNVIILIGVACRSATVTVVDMGSSATAAVSATVP